MKTHKLRAPRGTDEVNFGDRAYRVDNSGEVEVPEEAVPSLLATAGCIEVAAPAETPDGFVRVVHDDATAVSIGQIAYERASDGAFLVPAHAAADLVAHGFRAVEE